MNDVLGISSATLCLIHCLLIPLITIIPIGFSHNHWIDIIFAAIGLYALIGIVKSNSLFIIKITLSISFTLIVLSIGFTIITHNHSNLLYFGGIGMIIGHILNFVYHKH